MEAPSRRDEFHAKLVAVEEHCSAVLKKTRGATIVTGSRYRSLGITTLLTNYYRLTDAEKQRIERSKDWGASADVMAFKGNVDAGTLLDGYCEPLGVEKFKDAHDSFVKLDDLFQHNGYDPLYPGEMNVGYNEILIAEKPGSDNMVHPTGAIDMQRYNRFRAKHAIVELKTSKTSKNFTTMENAFLKVKHVKQVHSYAWLLKNMFDCAGIPFNSNDFELLIVGIHETQMTIALWRVTYNPKYFLGGHWDNGRWESIYAAMRRIKGTEAPCNWCKGESHFKDGKNAALFWCSAECRKAYMANGNIS